MRFNFLERLLCARALLYSPLHGRLIDLRQDEATPARCLLFALREQSAIRTLMLKCTLMLK